MKNSMFIAIMSATVGLAACARNNHARPYVPKRQLVIQAPVSTGEVGVVVSGLATPTLERLIKQNESIDVRIINPKHGLYELFGQTVAQVQQEIDDPSVLIEKNSYVPLLDETKKIDKEWSAMKGDNTSPSPSPAPVTVNPLVTLIEKYQGVTLTGSNLDFVNTCKFGDKSITPAVQVATDQGTNLQQTWIYFDLGQDLTLDATASRPSAAFIANGGSLQYQWLVTAPDDSQLKPTFNYTTTIDYTPDTTGPYMYSLVAKNSKGYCALAGAQFYVTANDPFAPGPAIPASMSKTLDKQIFWNIFDVGVPQAWQTSIGKKITIAIIDSGVNYNHPALSPNIWINKNEIPNNQIDDDNNGFVDDVVGYDFGQNDSYPFDDFGHGSHVAGIAASQLFGAARGATIMPIKATVVGGFDIATIAGAIEYAVDNGANIINMSLGWQDDYPVMRQALQYAEQKGVLVTVAAGNDSANNDTTAEYPADYSNSNIVSVAATDNKDALTFYSNYGARTVDIAAPGGTPDVPIFSAYKKNPGHLLFYPMVGTSMASPLVAGIAAQVWSADPTLTAVEVKQILLATGKSEASLAGKILSGRVIDAAAAVKMAVTRLPSSAAATRLPYSQN